MLTFWLFLVGRDGADEVLWCHVDLGVAGLADDLQCSEVAEDLVWRGVRPDAVLILHNLHPTHTHTHREARGGH